MIFTENSTTPDSQRLLYDLRTSKDANPVPLWFAKDRLNHGHDLDADMHECTRDLQAYENYQPAPHSPSMLDFYNNSDTDSLPMPNEKSRLVLSGSKVLREKSKSEYSTAPSTYLEFLQHHGFSETGNKICHARQKRNHGSAKFRTLDGSWNNFRHPTWGQSNIAFIRILPAVYSDGIYALRLSVTGKPLPNPRTLSTQLFSRRSATDSLFTLALMQWGQILAHDFARIFNDMAVNCCEPDGKGTLPKFSRHRSCLPIDIPANDSFYSSFGQTCMHFVRSTIVAQENFLLGPADQLNEVSSFLDLSPLYETNQTANKALRQLRKGLMRVEIRGDRVMMPTSKKSGLCEAQTTWDNCFESGDWRTNQNPQLIILHTLLIREHNRIAYELSALNPHWDDERLFQESRRIVIAEYQHITYRHWLPLVLGERYCKDHLIASSHDGLSNDYNEQINPGTNNGFTTGAFRFLHSMVEGSINLLNVNYDITGKLRLSNYYFRPHIVEPSDNFEALLRGLVYQTMQKSDANFHQEVTEYLLRLEEDFGMDLESIDIQRGRDHGLPSYNAYREICRLDRVDDFHGLINEISLVNIEKLRRVYEHVNDIDLLAGAAMENILPGSLLGPTSQCLIGEQFYRSRVGDKYFYDNANFPHSFTPEQFEEIKKASLATIICDSSDAVYEIQRDPFRINSRKNPMVSCFDLPKINLELWKEEIY